MAVVAEWLRRWTRNPLGSARAGSNPADCAYFSASSAHLLLPNGLKRSCICLLVRKRQCCRGRVVKAMDSKSIGLCPHRFESCRQRVAFVTTIWIQRAPQSGLKPATANGAKCVAAVVAEWLRRWTWNPLGYARTGSNPVDSEMFCYWYICTALSQCNVAMPHTLSVKRIGFLGETTSVTQQRTDRAHQNACIYMEKIACMDLIIELISTLRYQQSRRMHDRSVLNTNNEPNHSKL